MTKIKANETFARHAQARLAALGHYRGAQDGWAGPQTRAAFDAALGAPDRSQTGAGTEPAAEWDTRSAGNLRGVHPDLVRVMARARALSPLEFVVIEGLRTTERQRQLVASGASKTLNSRHLTGHAVDIVPRDPATGKLVFDWPLYHRLAPAVKAAAQELSVPIVWGGDWRTFRDGPHFELDRGRYPA